MQTILTTLINDNENSIIIKKKCECYKFGLKRCNLFIENTLLSDDENLTYCASGIFAIRFCKNKSSDIKIHLFTITIIKEIFNNNFLSEDDIENGQVLMIYEKRNEIEAYNFLGGKRNRCSEKSNFCAIREFKEELLESKSNSIKHVYLENKLYIKNYKYVLYKSYTNLIKIKNTNLKWINISYLKNII